MGGGRGRLPDVPDDSAKLAREKVEELRLKVLLYPDVEYYAICLRGWLAALAKEIQGNDNTQ